MRTKVRRHIRRRKGKRIRVRRHTRSVKAKALRRVHQMHPGISNQEARQSFDAIMESIKGDIRTKGKVTIPSFGTFKRKRIPAKKGGKKIQAFGKTFISKSKPASVKIKFYPSKTLKRI